MKSESSERCFLRILKDYQMLLLSRDGLSEKLFCTNIFLSKRRENAKFWWLLLADFWQVILQSFHQQITGLLQAIIRS